MKPFLFATIICNLILLSNGCKKENVSSLDCAGFRQGLLMNDKEKVSRSVSGLLGSYSREKVSQLAAAISNQCTVTATVLCFECIKTLPPQSEIKVSFTQNGSLVNKVLDISYTTQNKLRVAGVHD
jgi:hypothetical protein